MKVHNPQADEVHGQKRDIYTRAIEKLADRPIITIATGATCAYLGDERNLREYLVADEAATHLRLAGHTVFSLLFDDDLDPLNLRQLRVAVNKDQRLIDNYSAFCGKSISSIPDPWRCHRSFSEHFEAKLLDRLHSLDCHPTLISTSKLYQSSAYRPYVLEILERYEEVLNFLSERFHDYHPDKLFWVQCPVCEYIDETRIEKIKKSTVHFYCSRCEKSQTIDIADVKGKFNWKLDCALRWSLFKVDAEPFTKAYLEPKSGSYVIVQALTEKFFKGQEVFPLHYGTVKMDKVLSYKILPSLPGSVFRSMVVDRPTTDIDLTHDFVVNAASRHEVLPGVSFLAFVKQFLPTWLLSPEKLTYEQRNLLACGLHFSDHFLNHKPRLPLPTRESITDETPEILSSLVGLLSDVIKLRENSSENLEISASFLNQLSHTPIHNKKAVYHRLRSLVGQEHGLPIHRILSMLPIGYLQLLVDMIQLHITPQQEYADSALMML